MYVLLQIARNDTVGCLFQGASDVTVVVEDYSASGPGELSVIRGQQVEVVEAGATVGPTQAPGDWCLIRTMPPDGADPSQGLVPMATLKPVPILRAPGARNSLDLDGEKNCSVDYVPEI